MNMLVVELADIGDLVLTTPALSALRTSFPDARLDVLTTNHAAPILRSEVLTAQSAQVQNVSGATYTSNGYLTSLQAALDAAKF